VKKINLKGANIFLRKIPELTKKKRSVLARKIVSQYTNSELIESYKVGDYYWSASYTQGMIAVVISKNKVGIDVEKIVKRDRELFKISSVIRDWETFYRIWTGKEAIIKAFNLNLKNYEEINYRNHDKSKTVFVYDKKLIKIDTIKYGNFFISICFHK